MSPVTNRRWYDKEPTCTKLVEQMKGIRHTEVREFAAKCLLHFTERVRKLVQAQQGGGGPVSLGLPALQGLYMAKREHRRWYDEEKILQKAIGGLYGLPKEGLTALSFKLYDTFGLMAMYSFVCDQLGQDPTVDDLLNIAKTGLQEGKEEAEELLADIVGKDLYDAFSQEFTS